jgi:hypothetical protein
VSISSWDQKDPSDQLLHEALGAPLAGAFAQAGVQHFAGLGPGGQQRVVPQLAGVPVGGALLLVAVDLADRRVHVNHERIVAGAGPQAPGAADRLGDHPIELADVPEREAAQERAQRRGSHHPERQHRLGGPGPQHVRVIDVASTGQDRRYQRQDLPARRCPTDPSHQPHRRVHQRFEPETDHQRRRHQQPRVRHQVRVVEDHLDPVDPARYSTHRKCLPD